MRDDALRKKQQQETRRRLLAAARDLYLAKGYDRTSLGAVARAAGVTTGAVYANFEGKADLFLTVLEERADELFDVRLADIDACPTLAGKLRRLGAHYARRLEGDRLGVPLHLDLVNRAAADEAIRRRLAARLELLHARVRERLGPYLAEHLPPSVPVDDVVTAAIALVDGYMMHQVITGDGQGVSRLFEHLARLGALFEGVDPGGGDST